MKLSQMVDSRFKPTVEKLMKQPLPIKVAFRLKGSLKKMEEELNKYNELYKELINRHANKKEDGSVDLTPDGMVTIPNEQIVLVNKELSDLHSLEIEIDSFTVDELGKDLVLTVEELLVLEGFILA